MISAGNLVTLHPFSGMLPSEHDARELVDRLVQDHVDTWGTLKAPNSTSHGVLLRVPLALLELPTDPQGFLDRVGPKTRNMILKASRRGYSYAEFSWNDRLDDIYAINTSRVSRAGGAMTGWYVEPVEPRTFTADQASRVRVIGGFKDGRLRAYAFLVVCGDFVFLQHCIGHADDLSSGVMNGLVFAVVQSTVGDARFVEFGSVRLRDAGGLSGFKRHNGFEARAVAFELERDSSDADRRA